MDSLRILFWYWWCLALVLAALEMFIPGAAFLWVAGAAAITGLATMAIDLPPAIQMGLFGLLAVLSWLLSRRFIRTDDLTDDISTLNRRANLYLGRVLMLEDAMINGVGHARVGDTVWRVTGPADLPAGAKVRVTGVDGGSLQVEAA